MEILWLYNITKKSKLYIWCCHSVALQNAAKKLRTVGEMDDITKFGDIRALTGGDRDIGVSLRTF